MNRIMNMKNFFAPSAWRLGGAARRAATALLLCVLTMTVQTAWALNGNWSDYKAVAFSTINESAKTISITSEEELALLAYNTCNGIDYTGYTITLTKDLYMSDHYWDKSIGNSYDNCFRGTFNGDNKTISGINISSGAYKGLFGYVGQSEKPGTIQNVTLASSTIIGKAYVGGIVGYLQYGTVSNCHVLSSVSILASADDSKYFGGIVGQTYPNKTVSSATIKNCTSAASVTDNGHNNCSNYGGIVGYNYYYSDTHFSTVTGCFYYGTAVSASSSAGAIVGSYWDLNGISNCYYNCPSTISGIGYGNTDIDGTTRVYKLTLGTGATSLNVSGNATYTHNGTHYYAADSTATVATTDNTQVILALSATSGTISNLSIASDKHSATFTIGSSDVTLGGTVKTISGTCGNNGNVTWSLGGTNYTELTISGTGTMQNFEYTTDGIWKTKAPWGTDITKVTIGNGVTSIGDYAFIGCENLASITIGSGVTSIGIGALNHCDQMTTVTLPASVTTIAYAAFENCQKLETIYINHDGEVSLTGNHDNAFNAPNLQYIVFPNPAATLANTKETGNWATYKDKLRAGFGNQLFLATNEGGTAAYNIATETDLRNLATAVNGGANGSGQTFRQTDGITMTGGNFTPIGSSQTNYFGGTYDGGGKTLTVNISDTQNQGTALFRNIQGATIKNLLLSGSVTGTIHAATLVGFSRGTNTIDRCKVASNVTVTTPSGTNYHCGGLVGHALTSNLTISNTVYCGTITNSGNFVGGLQGWCDNGNTISITNCLFAGSYQGTATGTASFHPIAVRGKNSAATVTATNTYYEVIPSLGDYQYIAADGKKATAATSAPSNLGSLVETLSYMTIYQNGILFNGKYYAAPVLSTDNSGAYIINNAANWTAFCDMLYDNLTYNRFSGKAVKLGADITVSRMAGVDYHDFCGTFDGGTTDGGRHTLTFTATATDNYLAPFCNVLGNSSDEHAVIRNLKVVTNITADDYRHTAGLMAKAWGYVDVNNCDITANITATKGSQTDLYPAGITSQVTSGTQLTVSGCTVGGTIETNGKYAAGYVGILQGSASIQNSVSSVNIQSSTSGDGIHGGFVAVVNNGQSLTIEGCLFNGKIVTTNGTTKCGGFVGHDKGTGVTITNSLYAPTTDDNTVSEGCATFGCNVADANITNCYYTAALGTAQGTAPRSVTAGDQYVTTCTVSPFGSSTATYSVSGITAYNDGITRGDSFYYGAGDQVSLTLDHSDREGYDFDIYTASAGTLGGTTLTMPDADVTISTTWTPITYSIYYALFGGTLPADPPVNYTIESPDITLPTPTREGYDFDGWTDDNDNLVTAITTGNFGDKSFYAQWTAHTYTITYELNGGTLPADAPMSYTIESETFTLPTPTREGYRFDGWYDNSGFSGNPVDATIVTGTTGDMDLYAKWILLTTLYAANAANDWMTWCSPKEWTIDDSQAAVYTVSAVADGTVTLTPLTDATLIPAYVPVLILRKEEVNGEVVAAFSKDGDLSNLAPYSYTSVAYSASSGTVSAQVSNACFYGNPGTTSIEVADVTDYDADSYTLFALYSGTFLRVSTAAGFPANRCLLAVKNSVLSGTAASRLAISVGETTSLSEEGRVKSEEFATAAGWFTMDGRKLDGKPSRAGVYIYNGKKRVITTK